MKKKPISDETLVRLSTIDLIKSDDPVNYLYIKEGLLWLKKD